MKEVGKPVNEYGRLDYKELKKDPVYDFTTLMNEKPQRTRKVKKG